MWHGVAASNEQLVRRLAAGDELAAITYARQLNQVLRDVVVVTLTRAGDELKAHRLQADVSHSFVDGVDPLNRGNSKRW